VKQKKKNNQAAVAEKSLAGWLAGWRAVASPSTTPPSHLPAHPPLPPPPPTAEGNKSATVSQRKEAQKKKHTNPQIIHFTFVNLKKLKTKNKSKAKQSRPDSVGPLFAHRRPWQWLITC